MIFQGPGSPSRARFLAEYWQRKPCLLRQAFPGFVPELDENDIAGLACDELAEARLITGSYAQQDWSVKYGPFTAAALRRLPSRQWTLLVQDVEKHYPPIASLMASFDFLPSWRLDDLMVSVAGPEGSVGPHYDQYDVFLLQASGRRRWQTATQFDPRWLPGCELKVLASFTPETDWEVEPGDMLYLPPGIAHHGVALETGMTWSIGMRAPSQADLFQALGEWLAEHDDEGLRYQDGLLMGTPRPGEISGQAIDQLYALLQQPAGQPGKLDSFFASFLTRYRLAQQPAAPDRTMDETELASRLATSAVVQRNPWTRLAWVDRGEEALLCAAGDQYTCSVETAQRLCATPLVIPGDHLLDKDTLQLVCRLINEGHLFLSTTGEMVL